MKLFHFPSFSFDHEDNGGNREAAVIHMKMERMGIIGK